MSERGPVELLERMSERGPAEVLELMSERGSAEVLELLSERRLAQAPAVMLGLRPHPRFRPLSRHSSRCHLPGHRLLRLDRMRPGRERLQTKS